MSNAKKSLIKLSDDQQSFELNGHTYRFITEMSLDRFTALQYMQNEVAFGLDTKSLYQKLKLCVGFFDKAQYANCAKVLIDMVEQIDKYAMSTPKTAPMLKMGTIFIVREDEDITKYDEQLAEVKIKEWSEGGLEFSSFFTVLVNHIRNYILQCSGILEHFLANEETIKQTINTSQSDNTK